jgi:hypothetical protein
MFKQLSQAYGTPVTVSKSDAIGIHYSLTCTLIFFLSSQNICKKLEFTKGLKSWFWFLTRKLTLDGQDRKTSLRKG